jgi:quinol monooxygenase YgiN
MITIYAFFKINPGKEAEAEQAINEMVSAVEANEPGALMYVMHRGQQDPLEVHVFEMYKDGAAAATHAGSEHMNAFRQKFRDVFDPASVKIVQLDRVAGVQR